MIEALKFVKGAVGKKDLVPALQHFRIQDGSILSYNGMLALCSPIALDLSCSPRADSFTKAIEACQETAQLHLTENKRLAIRSGSFKAFVDCYEEGFPPIAPEGQVIPLGKSKILGVLKALSPFIAVDASRPWARGVLFRGVSAYATNNIILVQKWLGLPFPVEINIPQEAVSELIRIGEEPVSLQINSSSITFHYEGKKWIRTQTYSTEWPDVEKVLDQESVPKPLPVGFFDALARLRPFIGDEQRCYFRNGAIHTSAAENAGASVELGNLSGAGCFNLIQLQSLEGVADRIDFDLYPGPCLFYGNELRGVIVGMIV